MEMQFFVRPGEELKWFEFWRQTRLKWRTGNLGLGDDKYRLHDHEKLAHYANAATDIEFEMLLPVSRRWRVSTPAPTFDLSQHEKFSGKRSSILTPELNESHGSIRHRDLHRCGPDVPERALQLLRDVAGLDQAGRFLRAVLHFRLPTRTPVKCAVLPLVKKDGLPEKAREIQHRLRFDFTCHYDEKTPSAKRYRRQDAVGTPLLCVTRRDLWASPRQIHRRHACDISDTMELAARRVSVDDSLRKNLSEEVSPSAFYCAVWSDSPTSNADNNSNFHR